MVGAEVAMAGGSPGSNKYFHHSNGPKRKTALGRVNPEKQGTYTGKKRTKAGGPGKTLRQMGKACDTS